jgi:hypothetical protein
MQAFAAFFPSGFAWLVTRVIHPFMGTSQVPAGHPGPQALFEGTWLGLWVNAESRVRKLESPSGFSGPIGGAQIFSEKVFTQKACQRGARLSGVHARPKVDEIVAVTYGKTKGHFRMKWLGQPGSAMEGHMGCSICRRRKPLGFPVAGAWFRWIGSRYADTVELACG